MSSRALLAVAFSLILAAPAVALSLPATLTSGETLEVGGATVTIKRDAFGVPHIYADDAYALFWGNGYAMAEDRLFQMDVLRHVGKGESAAYLGPSQLEMDLATRRELYTDEERTARWNALPAEQRQMFQGFADGVNAFINETHLDPMKLSAEFYAIAHPPEQWVAEDTIAIAEFLLDIFGAGSGGNELENAKVYKQLVGELGEVEARKAFDDFFWMHTADTYTTIPPDAYTYPVTEDRIAWDEIPELQWEVIDAAADAVAFAGPMDAQETISHVLGGFKFGSNAFVGSPAVSESGGAILMGGPQMAYHNPMIPYELALHGAGFDALGMGVGGAPGVIIGRTEHMAWTVTSGSSDQVDVVAEKLVPGNARQYYLNGVATDMDCRFEVHYGPPTAIDQNPPVLATQEVCRTARGPVFAMNEDAGYAFVRERTHRLDELRSGILWLTLSQAQDIVSFAEHMETFCFEFNFHVADDLDNIAYYHFGCNPDRADGYDTRFPRIAGEWDWTGIRSGSELPRIVNPEKGYIVNWNNKPAMGWSSGDAMEKWGPVHRAELYERAVQDELALDGSLSAQDLDDINERVSTRSPFPYEFVPVILDATDIGGNAQWEAARQALVDWQADDYGWDDEDADGTYDSPAFAIYETWRDLAQKATYHDELGSFTREMGFDPPLTSDPHAGDHGREDNKDNVLYNAFHGLSAHGWCDDAGTTGANETCEDLILSTFSDTLGNLTATFGTPDVSQWNQDVRKIRFVALSGGPAWEIPMVNRPSFNHWYDFGTGDAGSVLPPGTDQSWEPLPFIQYRVEGGMGVPQTFPDAHKRDQLDLYVAFEWKPAQMSYDAWESDRSFSVGGGLL